MRDADAEPAEPTAAVVCGARATSSVPSSVRATWRMTPTTPWPTSAAARVHHGAPVGEQHDARGAEVVESLRVADVLEAEREADAAADALAPRRVAGAAREAERVAGQSLLSAAGCAAARRITSWVGSEPVRTCPVGSMSPGSSAFSKRSSTGSIPSSAASKSICDSAAKHVCTAPKPRIAPQGGLFV